MGYLSIDVKCKQCGLVEEILIDRQEVGPWECPECKTFTCERQLSAPAIRTSDSKSFRDGYKRPGWDKLKAEASLDVAIAGASNPSERKDLERERAKLTKGD